MNTLTTICLLFISASALLARGAEPYIVDFTTGMPEDWVQNPADTVVWQASSTFGNPDPGCILVDLSSASAPAISTIETPPLDLTGFDSPTLSFSLAVVRNNFIAPGISVWYDLGNGPQLLDSWGESVLVDIPEAANHIEGLGDYLPPLDEQNVSWVDVSTDLSAIAGKTNVRFLFRAEMVNGGWLLLDNVNISASKISGVKESESRTGLSLRPNPASSFLSVESPKAFTRLQLINALGETVGTFDGDPETSKRIDTGNYPAGLYWVRIMDAAGNMLGVASFILH